MASERHSETVWKTCLNSEAILITFWSHFGYLFRLRMGAASQNFRLWRRFLLDLAVWSGRVGFRSGFREDFGCFMTVFWCFFAAQTCVMWCLVGWCLVGWYGVVVSCRVVWCCVVWCDGSGVVRDSFCKLLVLFLRCLRYSGLPQEALARLGLLFQSFLWWLSLQWFCDDVYDPFPSIFLQSVLATYVATVCISTCIFEMRWRSACKL